jgi:hypothetical protein
LALAALATRDAGAPDALASPLTSARPSTPSLSSSASPAGGASPSVDVPVEPPPLPSVLGDVSPEFFVSDPSASDGGGIEPFISAEPSPDSSRWIIGGRGAAGAAEDEEGSVESLPSSSMLP